jgi:hypothetical protein
MSSLSNVRDTTKEWHLIFRKGNMAAILHLLSKILKKNVRLVGAIF